VRRTRSCRGFTLIEVTISTALLACVLGVTKSLVAAATTLASTTNDASAATGRADRALQTACAAIRRGSFATLRRADGTAFADATSDSGFQIQEVRSFSGALVLGTAARYRLVIPAGQTEGSIVLTQDGLDRTIANGVTAFTVTRSGPLTTLDVRTRSGPANDRARNVHATTQVDSRNP
jgi:prepilin-type N-terminal cleavage/methylation domain-containing protein